MSERVGDYNYPEDTWIDVKIFQDGDDLVKIEFTDKPSGSFLEIVVKQDALLAAISEREARREREQAVIVAAMGMCGAFDLKERNQSWSLEPSRRDLVEKLAALDAPDQPAAAGEITLDETLTRDDLPVVAEAFAFGIKNQCDPAKVTQMFKGVRRIERAAKSAALTEKQP